MDSGQDCFPFFQNTSLLVYLFLCSLVPAWRNEDVFLQPCIVTCLIIPNAYIKILIFLKRKQLLMFSCKCVEEIATVYQLWLAMFPIFFIFPQWDKILVQVAGNYKLATKLTLTKSNRIWSILCLRFSLCLRMKLLQLWLKLVRVQEWILKFSCWEHIAVWYRNFYDSLNYSTYKTRKSLCWVWPCVALDFSSFWSVSFVGYLYLVVGLLVLLIVRVLMPSWG